MFETKGFRFPKKIKCKGEAIKTDESVSNEPKLEYILSTQLSGFVEKLRVPFFTIPTYSRRSS